MRKIDPIIEAMIQQLSEDKVAAGEMFTAFDISRIVQNMGHVNRHENMKCIVHDLYNRYDRNDRNLFDGYTRTLIEVQKGKPQAWVYHPVAADPLLYKPPSLSLPTQGMTPQAFYNISAFIGQRKPDARGAVSVPAAMIRKIGAKPGDTVVVENTGTSLVVAINGSGRNYIVNKSNNIRIKRRTWFSLVSGSGEFSFEENSGRILITHK